MRIIPAAVFAASILVATGCGSSVGSSLPSRTPSPPSKTTAPVVVPARQVWHRQGEEQLPKEDSPLAADFVDLKYGWVVGGPVEATADGGGYWVAQMTGMWQSFRRRWSTAPTAGWSATRGLSR